jgi:hypothetical protein
LLHGTKDVGARHKAGHDDGETVHQSSITQSVVARMERSAMRGPRSRISQVLHPGYGSAALN